MNKQASIFLTFVILMLTLSGFTQANNVSNNLSAKNAKQYSEQFIIGGQPSENDLIILSKSGIKTVINLRGTDEFDDFDEQAKVEALGMNYIAIPISGASDINKENLALFTAAIKNTEQAFVHCASGNRVGAMFALDARFNHNKSIDEAIVTGKKAGLTSLEATVKKVIKTQ
ncbi:fused DSP-PTPase phosphatase/NAD kinase-like protein [Colwellia hornerae]|uniref:DSP-PTPase phosphatase fused to NAD+ Kinase domain-containing protein n=1 Tax=Colwellia hornerae TaxID=89402 RepID=A0A5C6QRF9_9GAMM|nr:protein tyrosine phosphatase family protein [Colwellia hornerae]TWX55761.1 hypothetical protein ESZ28_06230 [Colwellia hornerae]TWX61971.1 hypothetical protein ESZ26_05005 [Colwellia hornerae]TWX71303.1 hypothetical protein ESZ27_02585 [Colwellia hornerae]